MRELTRFEREDDARTLGDTLFVEGIQSRVDEGRDGGFVVWVHDETQMDAAKELLSVYERDPDDPRFAEARRQAKQRRAEEKQQRKKSRHKTVRMRDRWQASRGIGRLTMVLIIISVGVTLLSKFGENHSVTNWFLIASYQAQGGYVRWDGLADVLSGQVWRLITPIFVHYGFLHIIFNMLWLKDLGTLIEHRQSTAFLGVLVLATAVIPNLAQYIFGGSPMFGGMSGVVYGLLGYIWIRGKVDPGSGYALPRFIIVWMLGWLVLCFTGLVGHIANAAHLAGLLVGGGWGLLAGLIRRSR